MRNLSLRRALATGACALAFTAPALRADSFDPWTDLGNALVGANGNPVLVGTGSLVGDTQLTLALGDAAASAAATLVVGFDTLGAPFKGGILVPSPDIVLSGFVTTPGGALSLTANWPSGLVDGTDFTFQWWISDAVGPKGFAASNAVRGVATDAPAAGFIPTQWISGVNCGTDPLIQVEQYDDDLFILRQSMCTDFEAPFMYLLMGADRALLLDTGAGGIPIANTVNGLVQQWATDNGIPTPDLVVAHTHEHGDHVAGDNQFNGNPNTTVVSPGATAVQTFFGFQNWPNEIVTFELDACRSVDLIPAPGHSNASLAVYDRKTGVLFTGDTFYPGFLFIFGAVSQGNFAKYQASIQRLVDFVADKPLTHILGNHIEMTSTPGVAYPYGTNVQPNEHVIWLTRENLLELNAAVRAMGTNPVQAVFDDFIIQPSS